MAECECEEWDESWECYGEQNHRCVDCRNMLPKGHFKSEICSVCRPWERGTYTTKDSGKREEFDSGMVRDTQDGKPRYDLLIPDGVPYRAQFLTRVAELLGRGAEKYSDRNWERALGPQELDRFKSSAYRHFIQWMTGETDEDHAAAVVFNLLGYETTKWKMSNSDDTGTP